MIIATCRQCRMDTAGQHEWNCPFNRNNAVPVPRVETPKVKESCSIYKHLVYNLHMKSIHAVIQEAQDEKNLNSGLEWQFVRSQPVTEYEWVAIFEKWVY